MNSEKKTIKKTFQAICRKLGKRMVLVLLLFILIDVIIGGVLLWRYGIRGEKREVFLPPPSILNQVLLDQFSLRAAKKQAVLETLPGKQYFDSFIGPMADIPIEEPLPEE